MSTATDPRNLVTGSEIPKEGYCDQPYVAFTNDGDWVVVMTTGPGVEGDLRQHVVSSRSTDQGKTWSPLLDIEPLGPPEASWVMPLAVPGGRIYAIYVYNLDDVREVPSPAGGMIKRADTLGSFAFKYSDDGGRSWSEDRHTIPLRVTEIDRQNTTGGKIQYFWGVGKPMIHEGSAYFGFAKVGNFVPNGFMEPTEGWFIKSDNILTERDPAKIRWELLPEGEIGLRAPWGPVADEHNLAGLSDGSLYCTYRTIDGFLCHAYSRDGGRSWDGPQHATYTPGGRKIKHPRAANFVWKASNGKFLLWYHNHGGRYYMDRNPAWLTGGVEIDGQIHWSEPEIVLFDDVPGTRISYPDFVEQNGKYWITETQKTIARVHPIDPSLLEGLWNQRENRSVTQDELALDASGTEVAPGSAVRMPTLPDLGNGGGFSVEAWVTPTGTEPEEIVFNTRNRYGRGITLSLLSNGAARITVADRIIEEVWDSDPDLLTPGELHHVVVTVDGGPKIITFVVDGVLNDGGAFRPKGWHRFAPELRELNSPATTAASPVTIWNRGQDDGVQPDPHPPLVIDPNLASIIHRLRIYTRPLRTSEAVGNFQAGNH
jgi:hypothetical protein